MIKIEINSVSSREKVKFVCGQVKLLFGMLSVARVRAQY